MMLNSTLTVGILLTYLAVFAFAHAGQFCTVRGEPVVPSTVGCIADDSNYECLATLRGGVEEDDPEARISEYLSETKQSLENFHIHGWRWHTMSLVREAGRLSKLVERSNTSDNDHDECAPLKQAADYVVGFNLKGLHKIETDLFFPWMRQKLTSIQQNHIASAFGTVMDQLESDRKKVAELGESIQQKVSLLCDSTQESSSRSQAIVDIAQASAALEQCARSMMERENSLLVPAISQVVSESEQKSFNNKVLRSLGLLDSRLHLVGMHEAVWESNIAKEKELFEKAIPSIPQMMIPRWKRNLYMPRTDVLEQQS